MSISQTEQRFGAVELGGTKINVATGTASGTILTRATIATTAPAETIAAVIAFLRAQTRLDAIGIGSFGPICLDQNASEWGNITITTKVGWSNTSVARTIGEALGVPVAFDTDVNAAALGEYRWGALQGCGVGLYLTVGTGIGGGIVIDGKPLHGLSHPELGHVRVKRAADDDFAGVCPFHGDCIEGLASGPAIAARLGASLSQSDPADPRRTFVFDALGQALAGYVMTLAPHRIVIGGGVAKTPGFHAAVRARMVDWLSGYMTSAAILTDRYIAPPALGDEAGVIGAIALAQALPDAR